jgi:hypothetical protein
MTMNRFEIDPARAAALGAPVEDVAQEALDATTTAYANDAGIHVERHLHDQLASRGLRADDELISELANEIRSGSRVDVGRPDGTVDDGFGG